MDLIDLFWFHYIQYIFSWIFPYIRFKNFFLLENLVKLRFCYKYWVYFFLLENLVKLRFCYKCCIKEYF
jgi:hypothetical protein